MVCQAFDATFKRPQQCFPRHERLFNNEFEAYATICIVFYPNSIGAQAVPQLPWGYIIILIQKVKKEAVREWYAQKALQ